MAIAVPHQLLEGADERAALDLVMRARKALTDSGAPVKDFSTAENLLEKRKNLLNCTTGSSRFDSFLKGGIETQAMTEFAGEYGCGKNSVMLYSLCNC